MGYSIKVLTNEEFDRLPYDGVGDSLGLADVPNGRVFVRNTHIPELNEYLLDHELDHLVEETPTDCDHTGNIRYKKFRQGAGNVGAIALPIIGAALGGPAGAAIGGAAGGALKGGIGGEEKSLGGAFKGGAIGGLSGFAGSKLTGNFGMPNGTIGNLPQTLGTGLKSGLGIGNIFKNAGSMLGFGGGASTAGNLMGGTGFGAAKAAGFSPSALFSAGNVPTAFGAGASAAGSSAAGGIGGFGGIGSKQMLGAGLLGLGLAKPLPKAPELPQSVNDLRSQVQAGGNPLAQKAQGALGGLLDQQFNPLSEPEIQAATRQLEIDQVKAEDQVRDLYRNLRPGTDPSTDSSFRRDLQEVQDQFARAKADTLASRTRDVKSQFDQQRMGQIQQAMGISDQQMNQLMQLAQLDVQQIAQQLQLDVAQAELFKNTFTNLGSSLIQPPGFLEQILGRMGTQNAA